MPLNPLDYPAALMQPRYVSDASAWCGHVPFAFALVQMLRPQSIVELGTHKGDSYMAFCQAVAAMQLPTRCSAIDTWRGDVQAGGYGEEVLAQLRQAHDPLYANFSRLIRSSFDQAATMFAPGSIDLLHIDGLHTYDAVKHDYETWRPKLSRRGVVLFHDVAVRSGDFGVWRLWEELAPRHPHFLFEHAHGLGVLAVGDDVPAPVLNFLADARQHADRVRAFFARLGDSVEYARFHRQLVPWLAQQQVILNAWRQRVGLAIDSAAADINAASTDTINFVARSTSQLDAALVEDLRLRQELQREKTQPPPAASAITPRLVSVIICSITDAKFNAASAMYQRLLAAVPHEIIRISDARSMTEGYNRGIGRSTGDVLIFSHDDVEFLNADFAQRLLRHLGSFDLVGVAGTNLVCGPAWVSAGPPYLFGQVTHPDPRGFTVSFFGAPRAVITDIQALDGLFFALHRRVVEKVRFDESLPGFHYYDLDFTYSAFLAGFKLAVVNDIHAIHHSQGDFGQRWAEQAGRFNEKWAGRLPPRPNRPLSLSGVTVKTREEIWEVVHAAHLEI